MLFDDISEQLKSLSSTITTLISFWNASGLESTYQILQKKTEDEHFWEQSDNAQISKELQRVKQLREQYLAITGGYQVLGELLAMFAQDEDELKRIAQDVNKLQSDVESFKIELMLSSESDASNAFLNINAGAGGTESQDWSEILLRMYLRFCERQKFSISVIDHQAGEGAGIKSVTLFIRGKNVCGLLKSEHGIHRLVRISPFDAAKRRHTSFAAISVTPEVPDVEITINPADLRIDTFRAGGAGGQHVNKTESAVRITHIPSGIVTQCQNDRSQGANKETAMKMLKARLVQKQKEEQEAKKAGIEKKTIEWGSQIRSYVLHPYKMVKDHRTDYESPQPDLVLDGKLLDFIEHYLIWSAQVK